MEDFSVGPNVFASPPVWLMLTFVVVCFASLVGVVRALRG